MFCTFASSFSRTLEPESSGLANRNYQPDANVSGTKKINSTEETPVKKASEMYETQTYEGGSGKYYNADGSPIWPPNRGFDGEPVNTTLEPGTMVDRYGYDGGYFASPEGTSYTERALPVGTDKKPYTVFEIVKPVEVQSGKIAPWFGEKGGGIQYEFSNKISELLDQGKIRKVVH